MDIKENIILYTPKSELWIRVEKECWRKSSQCHDPDFGSRILIASGAAWLSLVSLPSLKVRVCEQF
jgi:hypothetical protein